MFGLVLQSTYDKTERDLIAAVKAADSYYADWCTSEQANIMLKAELARERNVHTDYWLDTAGRWRHPDKPCKCVSVKEVMTAKLKREKEAKKACAAYGGLNRGNHD